MKKLLVALLAGAMVLGCVACGGGNDTAKFEVANAQEVLTKVWDTYKDDEKFFAMGGDFVEPVDGAPGTFDLLYAEDLEYVYCIPAEAIAMVDDAATIMHAMNTNSFTAAAYHVADPANVQTIIDGVKEKTMNNQWMCGFPEKLIIVTVNGDYVVSAFGNGQVIDYVKEAITGVYGDAAVVSVEENLAQ